MNKFKKNKIIEYILLLLLFIVLIGFYISHPMYVFDADDWSYISAFRLPIPYWHYWNPTRVLPEFIFPILSRLGLVLIKPFTGDYIASIMISFSIFISVLLVLYFSLALSLINKKFEISTLQWGFLLIVFALYHFVNNGTSDIKVNYVLFGQSLTNTVYYTISSLVNACLVIYLMKKEELPGLKNKKELFILIIWIYFAINSNMFSSIILISYTVSCVLFEFVSDVKNNENEKQDFLKRFLLKNYMFFAILFVYALSIVFEAIGGRAKSLSSDGFNISATISYLLPTLKNMFLWLAPLILIIIFALAVYLKKRNENKNDGKEFGKIISIGLVSEIITIIFMILLCTKSVPKYISSSKVFFTCLFWVLLMALVSLAYLLSNIEKTNYFMPFLMVLLVYLVFFGKMEYACSYINSDTIPSETVKEIDYYIIDQVKNASDHGLEFVEVKIPKFDTSGNWPLSISYGGEKISKSLYKHGIIDKKIEIKLVPDNSVNELFGMEVVD